MEGWGPIPCRPQWPQGLAPDQQYQGLHGISSAPFQSAPYTPHQGYGNHPFGQYHTPTVPLPNMYQISTPQAPHPGFAFPMGYPPIPSVEYHLYAMDRPEYAPIPHPTVNYQFGPPNYATSGPGIELGPTRFTFASHPALQAPTVEARSEPIPRGHQNANSQAIQDDQITRLFKELVKKKEANRAEKDRKIEERIKRLEECNMAKEKESAMLKAQLSQIQHRLDEFPNADNPARESTMQVKSSNHPSEPVANPIDLNVTSNTGSRKRRRSIIKTEPDDDHEEFDSSALSKGKKRLRN